MGARGCDHPENQDDERQKNKAQKSDAVGEGDENPLPIVLSVSVVTVSRHNVGGEHARMLVSGGVTIQRCRY